MRWVLRIARALAAALVLALAVGATWQAWVTGHDRAEHPAPGRMLTVEGMDLHLDCRGTGRPIVVLEAGLTSGSTSWVLVHDAMSRDTEVCAYDRPGLDWSEPGEGPARADVVARRLHALLGAAGLEGPYVLVGMSAGGVYVRTFRKLYPTDVAGLVLVDSSHEQQGLRLPAMAGSEQTDRLLALCVWLQPLGLVRMLGALDTILDDYDLPPAAREVFRANLNQSHTCRTMRDELAGFMPDVRQAGPPATLGDLPLIVLSQGKPPEAIAALGMTEAMAQAQRAQWDILQTELAALSTRGERRIAYESGHAIQLEQPAIVVQAVADMVAALRTGQDRAD